MRSFPVTPLAAPLLAAAAFLAHAPHAPAQDSAAAISSSAISSSAISTWANPLDIDYRYNFEQINDSISYRSAADPVIVPHRGEYYLFATVSGGYWHSRDLLHWRFVTPSRWPFEDVVAPAATSFGDTLVLLQSSFWQRPILYTTDPASGRLEFYNRLLPPLPGVHYLARPGDPDVAGAWDPAFFLDDDGRWYMYWGSSNVWPLYGIELDPARRLAWNGDRKVPLLRLHPDRHGWERFGRDHRDSTIRPYMEGAWMTKHGGRYYLQYAAPGTEYNVYANGTYVGDHPLGPFTYAPYNPVAYKPGGYMTGAGHGNTFQDVHGNWWNTGTPWLAVNWNFERRLSMFPAGFDEDGHMYANTRFGDFPHRMPTRRWTHSDSLFTGWMLLSYRKHATASSVRDTFPAGNVTDEDRQTFWLAATDSPEQWLTIDLGGEREVRAVQVNYVDWKSDLYQPDSIAPTRFRMSASRDGQRWMPIADLSAETRDRANPYIELTRAVRARYVRYEHLGVAAPNLAVGDIRVFGSAGGRSPATPRGLAVRRDADPRNARVRWRAVPGAVGYNVRWGIHPRKLYQTYQLWADEGTEKEIRALTVGQEYWFAIEAFDESGVSPVSAPVHVP